MKNKAKNFRLDSLPKTPATRKAHAPMSSIDLTTAGVKISVRSAVSSPMGDTFVFPDPMIFTANGENAIELDHATIAFYQIDPTNPRSNFHLLFHCQVSSINRYVADGALSIVVTQLNDQHKTIDGPLTVGQFSLVYLDHDNYTRNAPVNQPFELGPDFVNTYAFTVPTIVGQVHK